jgi:hypothetical protein
MNYQYRYGTTTTQAIGTLYDDGGFARYYQGLAAALVQGPVSRFGDTAANAGILALLESNPFMRSLPKFIQTVFASVAAALFRIVLMPVDTLKTTLQTQGKRGWIILGKRVSFWVPGPLRISSDAVTDQNIWSRDLVVWGVGDSRCNFRWALPCRHLSCHPPVCRW